MVYIFLLQWIFFPFQATFAGSIATVNSMRILEDKDCTTSPKPDTCRKSVAFNVAIEIQRPQGRSYRIVLALQYTPFRYGFGLPRYSHVPEDLEFILSKTHLKEMWERYRSIVSGQDFLELLLQQLDLVKWSSDLDNKTIQIVAALRYTDDALVSPSRAIIPGSRTNGIIWVYGPDKDDAEALDLNMSVLDNWIRAKAHKGS